MATGCRRAAGMLWLPLVLTGLVGQGCTRDAVEAVDVEDAQTALVLALERNMEVQAFHSASQSAHQELDATVVLIPLNSDVIRAVVDYKCASELLDAEYGRQLADRNIAEFVSGDVAAFVLMVLVTPLPVRGSFERLLNWQRESDADDAVLFEMFPRDVRLRDEYGATYPPLRYTRIFDGGLSAGWNAGYVYFPSHRRQRLAASYSVHFGGFVVDTATTSQDHEPTRGTWSFAFDESEVPYLSLLRKGLKTDTIRLNYGIRSAAVRGVSLEQILSCFSSVLGIIQFFAPLI